MTQSSQHNLESGRIQFAFEANCSEAEEKDIQQWRYPGQDQTWFDRSSHPTESQSLFKPMSHEHYKCHKFYKPTSNRAWVLISFLIVISMCVALLELARAHHDDVQQLPNLVLNTRGLDQREILDSHIEGHAAFSKRYSPWAHPEITGNALDSSIAAGLAPQPNDRSMPAFKMMATWPFRPIKKRNEQSDTTTDSTAPSDTDSGSTTTPDDTSNDSPNGSSNSDTSSSSQQSTTVTYFDTITAGSYVTSIDTDKQSTSAQSKQSDPAPASPATTKAEAVKIESASAAPVSVAEVQSAQSTPVSGQSGSASQVNSVVTPQSQTAGAANSNNNGATTIQQSAGNSATTAVQSATTVKIGTSNTVVALGSSAATLTLSDSKGSASVITIAGKASLTTTVAASVISGSLIVSGTSVIGTLSYGTQLGSGSTMGLVTLTDSNGHATATMMFTGTAVLTDSNGISTATVTYGAPTSQGTDEANQGLKQSSTWKPPTNLDYFSALYLPSILAVALLSAWLITFSNLKMMEPFYQMATSDGGKAESTLTADYLASGLSLSFVRAAMNGHWIMLLAGMVQLLFVLILFLIPNTMAILPTKYCKTENSPQQPCRPVWFVNEPVLRGIEVLLVGCFSIIVMILFLNRRRVSGVYSDPSKVATMADLLSHKPLIQELRDLPAAASKNQIETDLSEGRYRLGIFVEDETERYGIYKTEDTTSDAIEGNSFTDFIERCNHTVERTQNSITTTCPYLYDFFSMGFVLVLFCLILAYRLSPSENSSNFNTWMASGSSGPRYTFNFLAISITFLVKRREATLRLAHLYTLMHKGPQSARESMTAGISATPFTSFIRSVHSRDVSLALLSLAAFLCDIMLILVPGIPWSFGQTQSIYLGDTYCSLIILGFVFIAQSRVTFKQWKRGGYLDCPDTLATVLLRLCASGFVEDKNNLCGHAGKFVSELPEDQCKDEQEQRYAGPDGQHRYRFGYMEGVDGIQRWMVEEDRFCDGYAVTGPAKQLACSCRH